jgi:Domain of unknown function (DUF4276)
MTRLLVHVEGQTEETFVNQVLAPHLYRRGYARVSARLMGNARLREYRGGVRAWSTVRTGIVNHLKDDQQCIVTTMADYYGMPQSGVEAWPGRSTAAALPLLQRPDYVERAISDDISGAMGAQFSRVRFVPFVVMHEFEGLLFSDCDRFARGIGRVEMAPGFQAIRDQFTNPEEINDSPITAPSKRVERLVPGYSKPLFGALAVMEIGLDSIRSECPHFRGWISRLEAIPLRTSA